MQPLSTRARQQDQRLPHAAEACCAGAGRACFSAASRCVLLLNAPAASPRPLVTGFSSNLHAAQAQASGHKLGILQTMHWRLHDCSLPGVRCWATSGISRKMQLASALDGAVVKAAQSLRSHMV